jgi:hypothetical protein
MPRRRRATTSQSLGGKIQGFRREVERVMESLRREIASRESELSELKAEYGRVIQALGGSAARAPEQARPAVAARARRGTRRRARALNWKQVYASLPPRFTLETLTGHPKAGSRSKPHLYAIISRWKKEKKIAKDASGGYRKTDASAASRAKRPARRTAAPKAAQSRPESPTT